MMTDDVYTDEIKVGNVEGLAPAEHPEFWRAMRRRSFCTPTRPISDVARFLRKMTNSTQPGLR